MGFWGFGVKDQSTVVYNIILHVVFLKLALELEHVHFLTSILILFTIGLNYMLIQLFSSKDMSDTVDPDLLGLVDHSVLNFKAFCLMIGICMFVVFFELMLKKCMQIA